MKTPRYWHSENLISLALLPFSKLYQLVATLDRDNTRPRRAPLPVISIGNVTAGGAGKTPTTLALIPILTAMGHVPHILTRGYGGKSLRAHRVTATDTSDVVGDEALLLAKAAPTWVGSSRIDSANAAAAEGATILVCDDALQHHGLHKEISLLVIDGPFGIGNGFLLPAGPLRETLASAISRCHAALVIGEDAQQLGTRIPLPCFTASLTAKGDTADLRQKRWFAFAGIGRPEKFYALLRQHGEVIATRDFPDHHVYTREDIETLRAEAANLNAQLITTAKDAVKIDPDPASGITVLEVALRFDAPENIAHFLKERLAALPSA